jgi:hypothetical protein
MILAVLLVGFVFHFDAAQILLGYQAMLIDGHGSKISYSCVICAAQKRKLTEKVAPRTDWGPALAQLREKLRKES